MWVIFIYIKHTYKQWVVIFSATIGLAGGILTFFPIKSNSNLYNLIIFLICLLISIIITIVIYKIKHIPDEEIWLLDSPKDKSLIIFPYQEKYLKAANSLAKNHYGKNAIKHEIIKKWYEKNPLIVTFLTDAHHKFAGYFDIIPLSNDFGKDFIAGTVKENEIRHYNILPPNEMKNAEYLYFAGISVTSQLTQRGKIQGAILLYSALVYLDTFYDITEGKVIYAIAATECGKNILEKFDFKVFNEGSNRKDKMDLYSRIITKSDVNNYKEKFSFCDKIFDYSNYLNFIEK